MAGETSGKTPRRPALSGRAAARLAALQALYQIDLGQAVPASVIADFLERPFDLALPESGGLELKRIDGPFFAALVEGVSGERQGLDDMLSAVLAEGWPIERLETLLKVVLRAGAFELGHLPDVPARVVVSQYVDLAHAFLDDRQTAMVNGVLDRLARSLRPEEFATTDLRRP